MKGNKLKRNQLLYLKSNTAGVDLWYHCLKVSLNHFHGILFLFYYIKASDYLDMRLVVIDIILTICRVEFALLTAACPG